MNKQAQLSYSKSSEETKDHHHIDSGYRGYGGYAFLKEIGFKVLFLNEATEEDKQIHLVAHLAALPVCNGHIVRQMHIFACHNHSVVFRYRTIRSLIYLCISDM